MRISLDSLAGRPYSDIIGYPGADYTILESRVRELRRMGVESLLFEGGTAIGALRILGKGTAGLVVRAQTATGEAALKIRRTDSPRPDMSGEAGYTRMANGAGVGPRLLGNTENFMLMEYLDGTGIGEWIRLRHSGAEFGRVVRHILEDCHRLDCLGLDHGELYNITRHVIIGEKTTIIDFESASTNRRAANVTSAVQGIYVGMAREAGTLGYMPPRDTMIAALGKYKRQGGVESFGRLLRVLRVYGGTGEIRTHDL